MQTRYFHPTDLEYFVKVCQVGSLSQAGAQLGVTQPALSKAIRRLEKISGAKLLERSARGMRPTQLGQELLYRGSLILSDIKTTQLVLQEMSGSRQGTVSIGIAPMLSYHFLPTVIQLTQPLRPHLSFQLSEGIYHRLLPRLLLGEFDFMISSPSPHEPLATELSHELLGHNDFIACIAHNHSLLQQPHIADEDLLAHPWVLASPQGVLRNTLNKLFKTRALAALSPKVETSCITLSKNLILNQGFIGFLPWDVIAHEQATGLIKTVPLAWLRWRRALYLLCRHNQVLSPAAQFVLDLIKQEAPKHLVTTAPTLDSTH